MQKNILLADGQRNSNRVLELLSPLSVDEIKLSPPYAPRMGKTYAQPQNVPTQNTPASVNDSPPSNGKCVEGWSSQMWPNPAPQPTLQPRTVKKEPVATVTPVQIQSEHAEFLRYVPTPSPKSNLTSSLAKSKKKECDGKVQCHNCNTRNTPLWRKDPDGNTLCNACGLFLKLHGSTRPLSLKTDVIKKRSSRKVNTATKMPQPAQLSRPGSFQEKPLLRPALDDEKNISSYGSAGSRPKNVLILPKPSGQASTPTSGPSPVGTPMHLIPIPSPRSAYSQMAGSPASVSGSACNSSAMNTPNTNQQFKRKKSEIGFEYSDAIRRGTPGSYGANMVKRTPSVGSSMHARVAQRKGSAIGLSTMSAGSLTYNNVNLLNQRPIPVSTSYFDSQRNPVLGTPGSVTSHSSFSSLNAPGLVGYLNRHSFAVPSDLDHVGSAEMHPVVRGFPPESLTGDDYFKSFAMLSPHDDEMLDLESMGGMETTMGNRYAVNVPPTKSSLTSGLRVSGSAQSSVQHTQELKDLDWLKFEI